MKKKIRVRPPPRQRPSKRTASLIEASTLQSQQPFENYEYEPLDAQQQHDQEIEDAELAALSTKARRSGKKL